MRIITGFVIVIVVTAVMIPNHPTVIRAFGTFLGVLSVYELYKIYNCLNRYVLYAISELAAVAFGFLTLPYFSYILAVIYAASAVLFFLLMNRMNHIAIDPQIEVFILSTVISFFFSTFGYFESFHNGNYYLLLLFAETILIDIGCYLIGKRFGHTHIFPNLSPNKTLEGYIGGTAISIALLIAVITVLRFYRIISVDWVKFVFFVICVAIGALFGDLAMSAVKRKRGVKDFSRILPGHGGILDRFDSILIALPAAYLYITFIGSFIADAT